MLDRRSLPAEYSVTAAALTAISSALDELLEPAPRRTAELPVARPPRPGVRNNFGGVAIDLHSETDDVEKRMALIAEDVRRAQQEAPMPDPVVEALRRVESAFPAFLTHRAIRRFYQRAKPMMAAGVTVVSSVNRGPADLALGRWPDPVRVGPTLLVGVHGPTHG